MLKLSPVVLMLSDASQLKEEFRLLPIEKLKATPEQTESAKGPISEGAGLTVTVNVCAEEEQPDPDPIGLTV